jgi:hypothetical protein
MTLSQPWLIRRGEKEGEILRRPQIRRHVVPKSDILSGTDTTRVLSRQAYCSTLKRLRKMIV